MTLRCGQQALYGSAVVVVDHLRAVAGIEVADIRYTTGPWVGRRTMVRVSDLREIEIPRRAGT